jgi:drug/metabolite transporter (DMT)-like permease
MYCYYFAIAHIPLADAVLLNFTGPVFTPLIALAWFGLALNRGVLVALLVGFAGVALIVRPEGALVDPAAAIGLAAGFLGAVSVVAIWRMGAGEPAARIVFLYTAGSTAISAVPMALRGDWPTTGAVWVVLAACGVLSALAHLLLARGCTIAPADRTNALSYAAVVFAALLGWAAWGERPGAELAVGTLLIAVAATLVTRRHVARRARAGRPGPRHRRRPRSSE